MSAKPFVVPKSSPQRGNPFTAGGGGNKPIEASCLEVPVRALGHRATTDSNGEFRRGEQFEEDSNTMLLFPRGAVIRLTASVVCGQDLMLINKRTNRYVHCRVTTLRTTPEVNYVEVEFTHSISDFWGISPPRDPARTASAIAEFAAQLSEEPITNAHLEGPTLVPAKALAATAGISQAKAEPVAHAPALESAVTIITRRPSPPPESDERTGPLFFEPRPMAAIPVCEPVVDPLGPPHAEHRDLPPVPELTKWESVGAPAPQGKLGWLAAAAAVMLCAILLSYRFYSPTGGPLPSSPQSTPSTAGESLQPADTAKVAAVVPPRTSGSAEPPSAVVVSAPAPEIATLDTPRQRVVLVSRMTMPVQAISSLAHDAPELSPAVREEPSSATPGRTEGLLGGTSPVPPPPLLEAAPEKPERAADSLTPARLLSSVQPIYPLAAKRAQIQGDVVVETKIDASGNVIGMNILSGPEALRAAATAALGKWKFRPASLRGQPTTSTSIVTLQFHLR